MNNKLHHLIWIGVTTMVRVWVSVMDSEVQVKVQTHVQVSANIYVQVKLNMQCDMYDVSQVKSHEFAKVCKTIQK